MTLMAQSEEELKSLLMKEKDVSKVMQVKEESANADLKINIQIIKIMASGHITSQQIDGGKNEDSTDCFLGLQNHCRW